VQSETLKDVVERLTEMIGDIQSGNGSHERVGRGRARRLATLPLRLLDLSVSVTDGSVPRAGLNWVTGAKGGRLSPHGPGMTRLAPTVPIVLGHGLFQNSGLTRLDPNRRIPPHIADISTIVPLTAFGTSAAFLVVGCQTIRSLKSRLR